jgi:transposase InsO family protein
MDQRTAFIAEYLEDYLSITDLCEFYNISRKTGYKWIDRYEREGAGGLEERKQRPKSCPHQTGEWIVKELVQVRMHHPSWGAKKLLKHVSKKHRDWDLPAISTVSDILRREGLVRVPRQRRKIGHPGRPSTIAREPNDLWCADFKGQFKTMDGVYCYPLTVTDSYSRYLLECRGLLSTNCAQTKAVFVKLFRKYGLPKRIRTDNGVPFATNTLGRLSSLSAWFVQVGIIPELIEPGKPQQNGSHERMHKTLKAEATKPPSNSRRAQQLRFDSFREEYNNERPHEALNQETPASLYKPSARPMPEKLGTFEYPPHFEVRLVSNDGAIRWHGKQINVSHVCRGQYVGLDEVDVGVWIVYFGPMKLGRLLEKHMKIEDLYGRLMRHQKV